MFTAKPKPIIIVTGLLLVLAILSTTSMLTTRFGFARPAGFNNGQNFQGNNGNGGNFQFNNGTGGNGNFQSGNGNGGNFQFNNGTGGNGGFQRRGGFNTFSILRSLGLSGQSIIYVNMGITILGILLLLLSAYGVWNQRRWGLNLAMVMSILFLFGAAPTLFNLGARNINWLRISITTLTLVASIPILVFGVLPSVRDTVTNK